MTQAYTVLARRYRSQNFQELVGQEAIAQTLRNAVSSGRLAHAFMFTGTRGVGKTSSARILAKAINCPQTHEGEPCGSCPTCQCIARGEDLDVIEIDGASNNGVEQIRDLRQKAGVRPARSPYKIYIIDEVHMLSGGAFNALLKTLEEPPSHVKFIFATTDIHKVPATIISRCQRFDFKSIPADRIAAHLTELCGKEGIPADAGALFRIARLGNGSMRDALSLLDRVLSLGQSPITETLLDELLGQPPIAAVVELIRAIAQSQPAEALLHSDSLLAQGTGLEQILGDIIECFRNLMLVRVCGENTPLVELPADLRHMLAELAKHFDAPTIVHLIALCEQTLRSLKSSTMGRALFDALIVRLALSEQFTSIRDLLAGTPAVPAAPAAPHAAPSAYAAAPRPISTRPMGAPPAPQAAPAISPQPANPAPPASGRPRAVIPPTATSPEPSSGASSGSSHAPPSGHPESPEAPESPESQALDLQNYAQVWTAVAAQLIAQKNGSLVTMLNTAAQLQHFDAQQGEATLEIPGHLQAWATEKIKIKLEEAFTATAGRPVRVTMVFGEVQARAASPAGNSAQRPIAQETSSGPRNAARVPPEVMAQVQEAPLIRELQEKLGAHVTQVEILEKAETRKEDCQDV